MGSALGRRHLRLVEDHCIEAVSGEEAEVLVELDGLGVGFGHGQSDCGES